MLYLIENGFLDKKVINRTVCPVILDLLKIDKADGVNGEHDIQLNAIGVSTKKAINFQAGITSGVLFVLLSFERNGFNLSFFVRIVVTRWRELNI